jgi:hypothetical protein
MAATTPGAIAPLPSEESTPSPAPTTTGVPRGSPRRSVFRGTVCTVGTAGFSCSGRTPASSSAPGSHVSVRMLKRPEPEARLQSTSHWPVQRWISSSLIVTNRYARASSSGSCLRNQMNRYSGYMVWGGQPVRAYSSAQPSRERTSSTSCADRMSAQVLNGDRYRPSASSAMSECM